MNVGDIMKIAGKLGGTVFKVVDIAKALVKIVQTLYKVLKRLAKAWLDIEDAAMKTTRTMGLCREQALAFKDTMIQAQIEFGATLGFETEKFTKFYSEYTDKVGKALQLDKQQIEQWAAFEKLGLEGAFSSMAENADSMGGSLQVAGAYLSVSRMQAQKLGLDAKKYSESVAKNINMVNKVGFRNGISGLQKMVALSQRLGVEISKFSDASSKFDNIQDAITNSANLQVLGGSFSQNFSNPIQVMSEAMYDQEAFSQRIVDTMAGKAVFDSKTGVATITNWLDRARIKEAAKSLGMSAEDLTKIATKEATNRKLDEQLGSQKSAFDKAGLTDTLRNLAQFDITKGKFVVHYNGKDGKTESADINSLTPEKLKEIMPSIETDDELTNVKNIAKNVDRLVEYTSRQATSMMSVREEINGLGETIQGMIANFMNPLLTRLSNWYNDILLNSFDDIINTIKNAFAKISDIFSKIWNFGELLVDLVTNPGKFFSACFNYLTGAIKNGITSGFNSIGFAEGTKSVPGNSYSGDKIEARLNSKEMVLNQAHIASLGASLGVNGTELARNEIWNRANGNSSNGNVMYLDSSNFDKSVNKYIHANDKAMSWMAKFEAINYAGTQKTVIKNAISSFGESIKKIATKYLSKTAFSNYDSAALKFLDETMPKKMIAVGDTIFDFFETKIPSFINKTKTETVPKLINTSKQEIRTIGETISKTVRNIATTLVKNGKTAATALVKNGKTAATALVENGKTAFKFLMHLPTNLGNIAEKQMEKALGSNVMKKTPSALLRELNPKSRLAIPKNSNIVKLLSESKPKLKPAIPKPNDIIKTTLKATTRQEKTIGEMIPKILTPKNVGSVVKNLTKGGLFVGAGLATNAVDEYRKKKVASGEWKEGGFKDVATRFGTNMADKALLGTSFGGPIGAAVGAAVGALQTARDVWGEGLKKDQEARLKSDSLLDNTIGLMESGAVRLLEFGGNVGDTVDNTLNAIGDGFGNGFDKIMHGQILSGLWDMVKGIGLGFKELVFGAWKTIKDFAVSSFDTLMYPLRAIGNVVKTITSPIKSFLSAGNMGNSVHAASGLKSVPGNSYNGDKVSASLNSKEMVLNQDHIQTLGQSLGISSNIESSRNGIWSLANNSTSVSSKPIVGMPTYVAPKYDTSTLGGSTSSKVDVNINGTIKLDASSIGGANDIDLSSIINSTAFRNQILEIVRDGMARRNGVLIKDSRYAKLGTNAV